jgi:hypothetical protein
VIDMTPSVAWSGGGRAQISAIDGERLELTSTRAFAPGSRPEGTLEAIGEAGTSRRIWVKVHGSRRQDDGSYLVRGRLLNATRELRDLLKKIVPRPNGEKDPAS